MLPPLSCLPLTLAASPFPCSLARAASPSPCVRAHGGQAEFFDFEKGSGLASDLKRVPGKRIVLSVAFPSSFPAQPPYVRVIRPRSWSNRGRPACLSTAPPRLRLKAQAAPTHAAAARRLAAASAARPRPARG